MILFDDHWDNNIIPMDYCIILIIIIVIIVIIYKLIIININGQYY